MAVKLVINPVRFSYPHVFEPYKFEGDDKEPQYSVTILIPKDKTDIITKIRQAIKQAYEEAVKSKWANKRPAKYWNPLRDGDEPTDDGEDRGEGFAGCYFLNAKSRLRPGVVDINRQPIMNSEDFYGGCYGAASIAFSGFENSGNKGISCFLNNLMKTRDGEPLGAARSTAEEDFADIADDEDVV